MAVRSPPSPGPSQDRTGRRAWAPLLLALLALVPLAGCFAPPAPLDTGDCPAPLDLPESLPAIETRSGDDGLLEIRDDTPIWTPVGNLTRIVPTSHDLVELLFLMGHGHRVAAVPNWIDHPPGAPPDGIEGLPRMGRPHNIPTEHVRAADPTIVLDKPHPLQGAPLAPALRNTGLDVVVFDAQEDLPTLARTYAMLGALLQDVDPEAPAKAEALWNETANELRDIHQRITDHVTTTGAHCPRAIYMFPANLAGGDGTAAGLALELAGAHNLAAQAGAEGYRTLSREALLDGDPERVVGTTTGGLPSKNAPRWRPTLAAASGEAAFLSVDPALTGLIGPRYPDGIRSLAEWFHPAAFEWITPQVTFQENPHPDGGLTVTVDATESHAASGALHYRFLPGDGTDAQESGTGRFTHEYETDTRTTAHLLIIDEEGRIHTERHPIEAQT